MLTDSFASEMALNIAIFYIFDASAGFCSVNNFITRFSYQPLNKVAMEQQKLPLRMIS